MDLARPAEERALGWYPKTWTLVSTLPAITGLPGLRVIHLQKTKSIEIEGHNSQATPARKWGTLYLCLTEPWKSKGPGLGETRESHSQKQHTPSGKQQSLVVGECEAQKSELRPNPGNEGLIHTKESIGSLRQPHLLESM